MSNLKTDCGGIKESAATAGAGLGCKHFKAQLSESYMPRRLKKEVSQHSDTRIRFCSLPCCSALTHWCARPEGVRMVPQKTNMGAGKGLHFKGEEMSRLNMRGYCGNAAAVNDVGTLLGGSESHYHNRTNQTWEKNHIQTKARVFVDGGERAVEQPAREFILEKNLQRKKRVDLSGRDQGIQGGKCYSDPSYSQKYWTQEGLNPCGRMCVASHALSVPLCDSRSISLVQHTLPVQTCQSFSISEYLFDRLVREKNAVQSTHTLDMDEQTLNWKAPRRPTFAEKQQQNANRDDVNDVSMLPNTRRQNAAAKYSSLLATAIAKPAQ